MKGPGWPTGGDGPKDGRTEGRKDGRLEIHPCVLQDIGPLGPLPKKDPKGAAQTRPKGTRGKDAQGRTKGPQGEPKGPNHDKKKAQKGGGPKPKGTRGKNAQGRAKGPQGEPKGPNMTTGKAGGGRPPKTAGGIAIKKDPNTDNPPPLPVHTI